MINAFKTTFEARELKQQTERLYHGESVDLIADITTDGISDSLDGYSVSGIYQPVDEISSDLFYSMDAEIRNGEVVLHWNHENDFGRDAYNVWGLLCKEGEASYPVSWRISLERSPSYPVSPAPEPLPVMLDFSKYTLLNAPWLTLTDAQEMSGELERQIDGMSAELSDYAEKNALSNYLPLSGGVVSGDFGVENMLSTTGSAICFGRNQTIGGGVNTAIGHNVELSSFGVGVGATAKAYNSSIAIGPLGASATGKSSIAIGRSAVASADNAIQIGNYGKNGTPNSLQVFDKMVLSGDNLTLDPERIPYLSDYATSDSLSACAKDDSVVHLSGAAMTGGLTAPTLNATNGLYVSPTANSIFGLEYPGVFYAIENNVLGTTVFLPGTTAAAANESQTLMVMGERNYLPYSSSNNGVALQPTMAVYRYSASVNPDTHEATLYGVTTEGIPTKDAYFCFEIEAAVPSGFTINTANVSAWTWIEGFELPTSNYAGKTLYMSCRLDCQTRGITASCWRVA